MRNLVKMGKSLSSSVLLQVELEDYRSQVGELSRSKKQLQTELSDFQERLEVELMEKQEIWCVAVDYMDKLVADGLFRCQTSAASRLQELEITSTTSSTIHSGTIYISLHTFLVSHSVQSCGKR
jgi:hypothetical protein